MNSLTKNVITTNKAPAPIGPYSQGIKVGNLLFIAGQGGLDPQTGELCEGIIEQTRRTLENIKAIIETTGGSMNDVVKTTVFLKDMNDFQVMNEIYATYFEKAPPARSTVQAARLPLDCLVEIEAIVYLKP